MRKHLPLTESQAQIWAGQQLNPTAPLYHMAFAFCLQGDIAPSTFRTAFQWLVAECDAMRTVFVVEDGVAQQAFLPTLDFDLQYLDWSGKENAKEEAIGFLEERMQAPFDLGERLFDALLIKVAAEEYLWYLNQHHLITDGWSKTIQFAAMANCYQRVLAGESGTEKQLPAYQDFVLLAAEKDKNDLPAATRNYWEQKIQSAPVNPAIWNQKNTAFHTQSDRCIIDLGTTQSKALRELAHSPGLQLWSEDLSLFTIFASLLFIYTSKISGRRELSMGSPVHNRRLPVWKQTPGLFIELFPMSIALEAGDTFQMVFEKVRTAYFDFLKQAQTGASSAALNKTFHVVLNYINTSFPAFNEFSATAEWLDAGHMDPGHHLKLQVHDFNATGAIQLILDTNTAIFNAAQRASIAEDFQFLLAAFMANPNAPISLLSPAEQQQLDHFNQSDFSFPSDHTIVDLWETQVGQSPTETAIIFADEKLSFAQLNEKANQLAHYLRSKDLAMEELVAVCLERSTEMMIALLAVLKAGAAYVPVDPTYPPKRIQQMMAEATPRLVILGTAQRSLFAENAPCIVLEEAWEEIVKAPKTNLDLALSPENLMYVIYTSGSTGRPKGVMNQYSGVVNRLQWAQETFQLQAGKDRLLQKTNFCFDVSVWELFWPLITGVPLVFAQVDGHKDSQYLKATIDQHGITTIHFVPTMLEVFLLTIEAGDCPSLKRVICSGEALKATHLKAFKAKLPHAELHNLYGPTEAAIDVSHWPVTDFEASPVPIGKPVANTHLYVLNEWGKPCPVGVPGELHIAGIQVARGYYRREELTQEKFIPNPFARNATESRMYKTGDLACWLPDGNIHFLGRMDAQVKVRGFRIELPEVEGALQLHPSIHQAVVLAAADANGQERLLAFVVAGDSLDLANLRPFLADQLPEYMIPALFFELAEIPFTANGKIDRKVLLTLAAQENTEPESYQSPQTEFEEIIQSIWQEVFQLERIGTQADFIRLGGDSLIAIRLITRINADLELQLPANLVFQKPSIAQLATAVEEKIRELLLQMEDMDS